MLRRARRCRCNCLTRFFESGAGRALLALLQIIGRFPLSREWGGGSVGFFLECLRTLCCRVFVFSLLFFLALPFFYTYIFLALPLPHTPHSRESGNLPVMPAKGGGFAPSALNWEIPAFAGMEKGGMLGFFFGCLRTLCCRVFVFSLPFFHTYIFFRTSIFFSHPHSPHPPFPRKRESPCDARRRRGICAFGAELGDSRFRGNGKRGEWGGGIFERWKRCGKGVENGFLGGEKK